MVRILFLLGVVYVAFAALRNPWLGVVACYSVAIFGPQFVFFWAFEGLRPFFWLLIPTLVGWAMAIAQGKDVSFASAKGPVLTFFLLWTFAATISVVLGPYAHTVGRSALFDSTSNLITMYSQVLVLVMALTAINTIQRFKWLVGVFFFTVIYFTYWANDRYLSGLLHTPRMEGP